jgi:WD40 repeat protein
VGTFAMLQALEGHSDSVRLVVFSPGGSQLASSSVDKTVRVWDVATGATLQRLEGHSAYISSVVFSPDGSQLASSSYDKTVHVWDVATGATLQTLKGHSGSINSVFVGRGQAELVKEDLSTAPRSSFALPQPATSFWIIVQSQWITYRQDRLLWLPPNYRPSCSAVYGNIVCIGSSSGQVSVWEFSFQD